MRNVSMNLFWQLLAKLNLRINIVLSKTKMFYQKQKENLSKQEKLVRT